MSTPTIPGNRGASLRGLKRHHLSPARKETRKRRRVLNTATATVTVGISTTQERVGDIRHRLPNQKPFTDGPSSSNGVDESQSRMGLFLCLPTEILHLLFTYLDSRSLGKLALTSSDMCVAVKNYVYTICGLRRLLPSAPTGFGDSVNSKDFTKLGKLLRDITLLQTLHVRLKTVSFFFSKLEPVHAAISEFVGTPSSYVCMGAMLNTYVDGWEEYEKARVYGVVQSAGRLEQRVSKVLQSGPSSMPRYEKDIRHLHRLVFLPPTSSDPDYGFWLTQILKPWPIVFQARLLYIITGPEDQSGFISWTMGCGCSSLQHSRGSVDFSELGRALRILHQYRSKDWSEDDIISIFDELTTTPNGWCLENVAQLLLHCGSDIVKWVLGNRAINGRVQELSVLGYYLAQACISADEKERAVLGSVSAGGGGISGVGGAKVKLLLDVLRNTLELLPTARDRNRLLSSLMGTWRDYLAALYDDTDPLEAEYDEVRDEYHSTLESLASLSTVLLTMVLERS